MPQHKALYLDAKFGQFVLGHNETPKPGDGELLVRVEAVGLNPVDYSIQKWGLYLESFPAIIGTDTSGVVVEVGQGVTNFAVGDRVLYQGTWSNERASYQQFNIATAATTAKVPNQMSFEAAATVPVCLTAAFLGLYNSPPHGAGLSLPFQYPEIGKYRNQPLFVFGGATSVGQFVIQLAKLSGFSPIITTASLKNTRYLKSLGATHVIDRHIPLTSLRAAVNMLTDTPIAIVYDAVSSAETQKLGYEMLADNGHMVVVLNPEVTEVAEKKITHVFAMHNLPHTHEISKVMYGKLTEWLDNGTIRPTNLEIVPNGLEGVLDGLDKLANGKVSAKKLVARPQLTAQVGTDSERSSTSESTLADGGILRTKGFSSNLKKKVKVKIPLWKRVLSN